MGEVSSISQVSASAVGTNDGTDLGLHVATGALIHVDPNNKDVFFTVMGEGHRIGKETLIGASADVFSPFAILGLFLGGGADVRCQVEEASCNVGLNLKVPALVPIGDIGIGLAPYLRKDIWGSESGFSPMGDRFEGGLIIFGDLSRFFGEVL